MDLRHHAGNADKGERSKERMHKAGRTPKGYRLWTPEEDALCREFGHNYQLLMTKLPNRSRHSLLSRCQMSGLRRKHRMVTPREIPIMRKLLPSASKEEIEEAFPGRTMAQIAYYREYYRIRRRSKPYKRTGQPILDAIRERCFKLRYSMRDLDEIAHTRAFFQEGYWRYRRTSHVAFGKAVAALGGTLMVQWNDESAEG